MKIKWYGHAAFRLETDAGVRIIIDPYESGAFSGALNYGKISDKADIVLITHDHADHNYTGDIEEPFTDISKEGTFEIKGVVITGIPTFHDPSRGSERGGNLVFVIEADGLRLAHLGDLGHSLEQEAIARIGKVDVLLLPVGGYFTIDAAEATQAMNAIRPAITIPMHFKTDKVEFPIAGVTEFTRDKGNVKNVESSEIEVNRAKLPNEPEILVLKYSR
jgi:L-ascorbate metabolism protein UlaG (beta-lactamase superfamily)